METRDILVSTIIPSYNQLDFLKIALQSVLEQSHENQEIIIINDYVDPYQQDLLDEFKKDDQRIQLVHNARNLWIAASRNKWLSIAKGKYIAFLDHDDLRNNTDKIKEQLQYMLSNQDSSLIGSNYSIINETWDIIEKVQKPQTDEQIRNVINFYNPILQSTFFMSKEAITKVWWFMTSRSMSDDYDLIYRMWRVWKLYNLPIATTHYRLHPNNTTKFNLSTMRKNSLQIFKEHGPDYPNYYKAYLFQTLAKNYYPLLKERISPWIEESLKRLLHTII